MIREYCPDWPSFRAWIDSNLNARQMIWRGQRDPAWPHASSFEREILRLNGGGRPGAEQTYPYGGRLHRDGKPIWEGRFYAEMRDKYLTAFKRAAAGLRGPSPASLSEEEWWSLGRHHGLVTPLLDWSESPYIAAFFALHDLYLAIDRPLTLTGTKPVAVYALLPGADLENSGVRVVRPTVQELGRMHGQRGLFTWLNSERYFELQGALDNNALGDRLIQISLSDHALLDGLRDLALHGIDHRLLFPDLDGAAKYANAPPTPL